MTLYKKQYRNDLATKNINKTHLKINYKSKMYIARTSKKNPIPYDLIKGNINLNGVYIPVRPRKLIFFGNIAECRKSQT